MPPQAATSRLTAVVPSFACPGGVVQIQGTGLTTASGDLPDVRIGDERLQVIAASSVRLTVLIGEQVSGGTGDLHAAGVSGSVPLTVGRTVANNVHQVDNPVVDGMGQVYATFSGSRGQRAAVSIFRIVRGGAPQPFSSAVVNPTSMAIGPDGALYASSRFDGTVSRIAEDGSAALVVSNLGVPCGLAFAPDGALYVGDRSGTIFRASVATGDAMPVATLPPSVAAFHLAFGPDGWLYVTGPTLSPSDPVRRIDPATGAIEIVCRGFGRPQGLAFDRSGVLHVVDALAGGSGLFRVVSGQRPQMALAGSRLVGVAFDPEGGLVVASSEALYRFDRAPDPPA